jgi:hypothetical protein
MDEDIRQMELVGALRGRLTDGRNSLTEVTHSSGADGLDQPAAIEGRLPDLIARSYGKLVIGLARSGAVSSDDSIDDYRFFGTYREPGADEDAAINLVVPKAQKAEAEAALAEAGLTPDRYYLLAAPVPE